ncbi:MAG: DEAD/DEAH box helicase family protein [Baekduia sp.]
MTLTDAKRTGNGLRAWQVAALDGMASWESGAYLISAAPGAGKTRPSLEVARQMLKAGAIDSVVVACPTAPLTRQWSEAAAELGVQLQPDSDDVHPPSDFHGIAVTYAKIASSGKRWAAEVRKRTLVIADEAHHLGEDLAWGDGFAAAFGSAKRWLLLSGTPFRSDTSAIPGVRYDAGGVAVADISYSYADAVRDGVCRPVTFIPYDGVLQWQSGDDVIEAGFDTVLSTRESARRYRTAISAELSDGLPRILRAAHEKLLAAREAGHKDAGGLVFAADSGHARQIAKLLREVTGKAPVIVLHNEAGAHKKLAAFTRSREAWIVAVNMVSEGVDIPRLRVGVYAGAAKTPLLFRQVVGRFVRTIPGRPLDPSWLYLPGDSTLRRHAAEIDTELRHVLRPSGEPGELDEPPERTETEKSEDATFSALSADVAPEGQMSLFGGAAPAVTPAAPAVPAAWQSNEGEDETPIPSGVGGIPSHRRRKILREKRHSLVADLGRRDRRTHGDINAWVNGQVGIARVQDATIEQLERSVDLLLGALSGRPVGR